MMMLLVAMVLMACPLSASSCFSCCSWEAEVGVAAHAAAEAHPLHCEEHPLFVAAAPVAPLQFADDDYTLQSVPQHMHGIILMVSGFKSLTCSTVGGVQTMPHSTS